MGIFLHAALYLMSVSLLAGFWGQYFVRKLVAFLKRASIIVFILSAVIFASALTMGNFSYSLYLPSNILFSKQKSNDVGSVFLAGVIGTEKSIQLIKDHAFMGFLDFCLNQ